MNELTKCNELEWIIEGERLKRLREYYQISRDDVACQMKISETRLERLENGMCVRDVPTLLNFYKLIIDYHVLSLRDEEVIFGMDILTEDPYIVEEKIMNDISRGILDLIKANKSHMDLTNEISNQQNSIKSRSNSWKII